MVVMVDLLFCWHFISFGFTGSIFGGIARACKSSQRVDGGRLLGPTKRQRHVSVRDIHLLHI